MKKIYLAIAILFTLESCTENDGEKLTLPYTKLAGEYVVELNLTQPSEASSHENIFIYNDSFSDSVWIEDPDFFESKVKVKWNGDNTFNVTGGLDILHGEVVNITGEVFPDRDSVSVEWRYLQGGDPADDYIVKAVGVRYNGLTN